MEKQALNARVLNFFSLCGSKGLKHNCCSPMCLVFSRGATQVSLCLMYSYALVLLWWESLHVLVTCEAVLARDFISSVRNILAKEVCR